MSDHNGEPADLTLRQLREFRAELAEFRDELARFQAWQEAEIDGLHKRVEALEAHLRKTWPKHKFQGALHMLRRDIEGLRAKLERVSTGG